MWRQRMQVNNTPHALLLSGGTLSEKNAFALNLAAQLLCATQNHCGQCSSCHWMKKAQHPDLFMLMKEEKTDSIKIDDVRQIIAQCTQASHQGSYRVIIFSPAEAMPVGAQNALLKILEEPPEKTVFILVSDYPSLLAPTVRSRCQKKYLPNKNDVAVDQEILNTLQKVRAKQLHPSEAAAQYQGGALDKLLDQLLLYAMSEIKKMAHRAWFFWYDQIQLARRQLLLKNNPNQVLVMEHLFYELSKLT